jgi:thymidylate synthase
MNTLDFNYLSLLDMLILEGVKEENRTGIAAYTLPAFMLQHDMSEGFPILTIKKIPFKTMKVELEGFIRGIFSKKWYQDRGCHIWDEWCNPRKVPYSTDPQNQKLMASEDDLGSIYGCQWRNFNGENEYERDYGYGVDQLQEIVTKLKTNPQDRRMLCSAWNPLELDRMALPPCHVLWQVSVINNKLNLTWYQRSVDVPLGLPFNISSYGLLLHLLAKEAGLEEGILTGFLNNVHYYENQREGVLELVNRHSDFDLPRIRTEPFTSIFNWEHSHSMLDNYESLSKVVMPIAV